MSWSLRSATRTPSMYPASADFTFYGGLYRGVDAISAGQPL